MGFDYDLFVIGGGSGGVRAARIAATETGTKVALAEEDRYGGTCVIRGCVPKKLMVFASEAPQLAKTMRGYGWDAAAPGAFDWNKFHDKLLAELDRLENIYHSLLEKSSVKTYSQRARLIDAHTVELADGTQKTAAHILVATGGRPVMPDIPGIEQAISSNEIFHLPELPKKMVIVGGGYIASEFAGVMNGLGVEVTQYYRGEQILRGFDNAARNLVADEMRASGINLVLGQNVTEISGTPGDLRIRDTAGNQLEAGQILFATGRHPNTEGLGLEELGVELDKSGAIVVDEYSQTAVPSIYSIGDVTNRVNLTPVAIREGMHFVDTVFRGKPNPIDHTLIPTAIFTQPEIGTVGLSEEDAAIQEKIEVYEAIFPPMRGFFAGETGKVMYKLVVSQATGKVLGCHIVSPGAGEMIQLAGVAIKMGATKEDFDRTVAVHPTMAEEIVTMRHPTRVT